MKRFDRKQIKPALFLLFWACLMFAEELARLALARGAAPEDGVFRHIAYSLLYGGRWAKVGLLVRFLILLALAALQLRGIQRAEKRFWVPALILALFFTQNTLIYLSPTQKLQSLLIVPQIGLPENVLFWATMTASYYSLTLLFCGWMRKPFGARTIFQPKRQLLWAGIILLCWLPLLILRAPGSIYLDTTVQIMQYQGYMPIQASSPVLLTFVYGILMTLGQRLGGNNLGLFFCVLFQVALGLYALSFGCEEAASRSGKKYIGLILSLFFGLAMVYPSLAQGALKDAVYSPLFLLLVIFYCRALEDGSKKNLIPLVILALLCGATRKGGMYLSALILLCLACQKNLRRFAVISCLTLVAVHGVVNWAIYPAVGIESPDEKENYSFFYQLTGYYCSNHPDWVTEEEQRIISQVLDYDTVVTKYNSKVVDEIKSTYHADNAAQLRSYLLLQGKLFLKHPLTMLEAVVYARNWSFCPFIWEVEKFIGEVQIGFDYVDPQLTGFSRWLESDTMHRIEADLWEYEHAYPARLFLLSGLYNWLALMLGLAAWYSGSRERKVMVLPTLLAVAGLLLTHVNGSVRYAGPVIYSVPILLILLKARGKEAQT